MNKNTLFISIFLLIVMVYSNSSVLVDINVMHTEATGQINKNENTKDLIAYAQLGVLGLPLLKSKLADD